MKRAMIQSFGLRHGAASLLLFAAVGMFTACGAGPLGAEAPQTAATCGDRKESCEQCIAGPHCGWCDGACVALDAPGADARDRPKSCPAPKPWTPTCK